MGPNGMIAEPLTNKSAPESQLWDDEACVGMHANVPTKEAHQVIQLDTEGKKYKIQGELWTAGTLRE